MDEAKGQRTKPGQAGGRRRSPAERAQVLGEYRASGLTQERFAARAGIKVGTLRGWIYHRRTPGRAERGHFAPVRIVGAPAGPSRGAVTVRWPRGVELEIAVDLDGPGIERLVRELLAPCWR